MAKASAEGVGLGLRLPHVDGVADSLPAVPFWEIAPENILGEGGRLAERTMEILARYPVLTHGLSLSVGGFDPWDAGYLDALADFLQATQAPWHSEHLCFSAVDGAATHELLPLPFTAQAARHAASRARELQSRLPVPLLLENITYYAELGGREMEEARFIAEVLEAADAGWLEASGWGRDPWPFLTQLVHYELWWTSWWRASRRPRAPRTSPSPPAPATGWRSRRPPRSWPTPGG